MRHSQRIAWFEAAYDRIRAELMPDIPPAVTLTIGFPIKKKSSRGTAVGECAYNCMANHGDGFGAENIITLHPLQGDNLVQQLGTLVHECIHHMLFSVDPKHGHKKLFQAEAKKVGLVPPWTATEPDEVLQNKLRQIALDVEKELGYSPVGHYVQPPPPPKKPSTSRQLECGCAEPCRLSLSQKKVQEYRLICGICHEPFRVVEQVPGEL